VQDQAHRLAVFQRDGKLALHDRTAGDSADQMGCLHMCTAGGYAAGKRAADYASETKHLRPLNPVEVAEEKERVFKPFGKKHGISYWEFEDIVRIITTDHFGPVKTENSLKSALTKLERLDNGRGELGADNFHELMRVHEAMNIQQVAKLTATAALTRRESRFSPYHHRADFPETNDAQYCGLIVVNKGRDGNIATRFEPLSCD